MSRLQDDVKELAEMSAVVLQKKIRVKAEMSALVADIGEGQRFLQGKIGMNEEEPSAAEVEFSLAQTTVTSKASVKTSSSSNARIIPEDEDFTK